MKQLIRYLIWFLPLFAAFNLQAQNNTVYGAGISYTNGVPSWVPNPRTSRAAVDTVTGRWYHFNTPGGWQWIGNTVEEIAGCAAPAYTPDKGDSRLVINNCVKPEVYWYDGTAWKWINEGTTYFAGEGIRIENDTIIIDSLNFLDFRTGNALDGDVGRVQWNDTDGTLDLNLKGGNVTLQIGQEEVSLVKHADNSGLIEGRVVYIVGSDGANKTVRYALADSDLTSATTFGLMTESATGGNKAFCTTFGLVRNLNTTNLTEGGIVWLSADTAGFMTAVRPTAPDHGVMIGFCVRKHATQGAIFVQVQNGYELNELHDVFAPTPLNGQVLTYNSANLRWEAITPANQLQTLSTDGSAGNISISSGNTITLNVNDADASVTNELQTLSVAANTATLSNSGGSVTIAGAGINTVGTAGTTITVTGTEIDGSTTNELQTLSLSGSDLSISGGNTVTLPATGLTGNGISPFVAQYNSTNTLDTTGIVWNGGRMGVGLTTTSPSARFHVRGSGTSSSTWTAQFHNSAGNNNALMIRDDGNVGVGTSSPSTRFNVHGTGTIFQVTNSSSNKSAFRALDDGGIRMGNGSNSPYFFPAADLGSSSNIDGTNLTFYNYTTSQLAPLGKYLFTGEISTQTSGDNYCFYISERFSPTSGNATSTAFYVRSAINQTSGGTGITRGLSIVPSLTNAVQYQSVHWNTVRGTNNWGLYGQGTALNYLQSALAIGTTSPNASAALDVTSTTQGILFPRMTTTQRNAIATPADGLVIYNTTDNKLQVRAGGAWVDLH